LSDAVKFSSVFIGHIAVTVRFQELQFEFVNLWRITNKLVVYWKNFALNSTSVQVCFQIRPFVLIALL